ncbi:MAG: hypothetical protein LUD81_04575 [Clostridiales bacterium]|nr:hypothetical protein [Clostridiales bacterium]
MNIKIEDKGLLAAMLDEAEELLKKPLPESGPALKSQAEKTAKTINQITEKAAELIDEKAEDEPFSLDFSVELPKRYYEVIESLAKREKKLSGGK